MDLNIYIYTILFISKLQNILNESKFNSKICDFGISKKINSK